MIELDGSARVCPAHDVPALPAVVPSEVPRERRPTQVARRGSLVGLPVRRHGRALDFFGEVGEGVLADEGVGADVAGEGEGVPGVDWGGVEGLVEGGVGGDVVARAAGAAGVAVEAISVARRGSVGCAGVGGDVGCACGSEFLRAQGGGEVVGWWAGLTSVGFAALFVEGFETVGLGFDLAEAVEVRWGGDLPGRHEVFARVGRGLLLDGGCCDHIGSLQ